MAIKVSRLVKRFGTFAAVDDVSFEAPRAELTALLGPSGGGKSTILRVIAGLDRADSGVVMFGDTVLDHLDCQARGVGFVFQHYALFRHMTVAENIAFGLSVRGFSRAARRSRVRELLDLVGLHGFDQRLPAQLSGGQRQRVALARALAPEPRLLLLDEPFAAVDTQVRKELRRWLRRLHDEMKVTSLFVTHDQDEACEVADRVVIINQGRVEQVGSPEEIIDHPANEFVARFFGEMNTFEAEVREGKASAGALSVLLEGHKDGRARVVVRTSDLELYRDDGGVAVVRRLTPLGDGLRVEVEVPEVGTLTAHIPRRGERLRGIEVGCRVGLEIAYARAYPV